MEHKGTRAAAFRASASAFLKKQGFYVVLGLCILCIGIAAAVALLPKGAPEQTEPTPMAQAAGASEDERLEEAILPTPTASPKPTAAPTPTAAPKATSAPAKKTSSKTAPPVEGEIIWGYAVDALLYSETLEQWTTHDGVDIAARMGSEVNAIKGGTVQNVYEDSSLGITVEIAHDGDLVSVYANLAQDPQVEEGQRVDAGTTLGTIGDTAVSECAMDPHLHFALYEDGEPVDPAAYVLLGA